MLAFPYILRQVSLTFGVTNCPDNALKESTGKFRSDAIFMTETNEKVSAILRSHGVDADDFTVIAFPIGKSTKAS